MYLFYLKRVFSHDINLYELISYCYLSIWTNFGKLLLLIERNLSLLNIRLVAGKFKDNRLLSLVDELFDEMVNSSLYLPINYA